MLGLKSKPAKVAENSNYPFNFPVGSILVQQATEGGYYQTVWSGGLGPVYPRFSSEPIVFNEEWRTYYRTDELLFAQKTGNPT